MTQREIKISKGVINRLLQDKGSRLAEIMASIQVSEKTNLTELEQERLNNYERNTVLNLITQPLCIMFFVGNNAFDSDADERLFRYLETLIGQTRISRWYDYA